MSEPPASYYYHHRWHSTVNNGYLCTFVPSSPHLPLRFVRAPAEWTFQQFREAIPGDNAFKFLIHDRDSMFSAEVDGALNTFGLKVLRTPVRAPKANAYCERLIGTVHRKCLDFMIPLSEKHMRRILREWISHYNHGRPHSTLSPGIPAPLEHPCAGAGVDTGRQMRFC